MIPTYMEAGNIEPSFDECAPRLPGGDVLVIDDSSPDGTAALAERRGARVGRDQRPASSDEDRAWATRTVPGSRGA